MQIEAHFEEQTEIMDEICLQKGVPDLIIGERERENTVACFLLLWHKPESRLRERRRERGELRKI